MTQLYNFIYLKPFKSQDLISNSMYCLPYSSCDVRLESLVLDQPIILFFTLITCLLDIVLILWQEILSWSLMGVKGLITNF